MRRSLITAAVAVAAVVALPQVAQGATLHQDGKHRVLLQDTAGDANLVTVEGSKRVLIEDLNVPIEIDDAPACMPVDAYSVSCAPSIRIYELDLGDGFDVATVNSTKPIEVEGGHGRDRFNAGLTDGPSQVRWIGGIGLDTISYAHADAGVNVAPDLDANDGRPGDGDQVFNVKGSLDRQFARTPYAVSFTAGTKAFTLVTLHVLYGETKAEKQRRAKELAKIAEWLDARANELDKFNRNLIALGDFNIDRRDDPYWLAFASTGLGAPIPLQEARRNIAASSGGTDKYYDQIAWFQDGNLAKLTLEYNASGSFLWTDYILQGMTNPSKKARISDHYPLWVEFRRN
jgi:hypothetical protein